MTDDAPMTDETFAALSRAFYRRRQTASPRERERIDAQRDALRAEWGRTVPQGERSVRAGLLRSWGAGLLPVAD
ncbi:MAG: hypothetical protein AAGI52_16205 [Bacteroidota bacterium]